MASFSPPLLRHKDTRMIDRKAGVLSQAMRSTGGCHDQPPAACGAAEAPGERPVAVGMDSPPARETGKEQEGRSEVTSGRRPVISFESKWGSDFDSGRPTAQSRQETAAKTAKKAKPVRRSLLLAYVLWLVLGILGAHRFYLKRPGTALIYVALFTIQLALPDHEIALWAATFMFLFWIVDAFMIPGMLRKLAPPERPAKAEGIGPRNPVKASSSSSSLKAEDAIRLAAELGELAEAAGMEGLGTTMKIGSQALAAATGKRLDAGRRLWDEGAGTPSRHEGDERGHPSRKTDSEAGAAQDVLAAIEKLHALYQAGALDRDEFEREKKELLRKL